MTTYLITGGTGLIGNYVVRSLVDRDKDDDDVIVYDLYPNEEAIEGVMDDITLIRGDVTDTDQLLDTCDQYDPDRILHFGAYVAHKSWENPTEAIKVNGIGTNNVFDAAHMHDVKTCLYASSASVYGTVDNYYWKDDPVIVDEEDPVKPQNPYAATKYDGEDIRREVLPGVRRCPYRRRVGTRSDSRCHGTAQHVRPGNRSRTGCHRPRLLDPMESDQPLLRKRRRSLAI
jgi:UDP-glucose 4-epimerase